jgi:hypothetical protein
VGEPVEAPRLAADEVFTLHLQNRKYIMILVKRAVSGGHPLKCVDLAALLDVKAHGIFDIELTLKTGALFKNVEIQAPFGQGPLPSHSSAVVLSLSPEYDKKSISHG